MLCCFTSFNSVGLHVFSNPHVCAYYTSVANCYTSKNRGIGIYNNVVADNWMTWNSFYRIAFRIKRKALCAKRNTLVYFTLSPITHVAPITTPVPWSIVKYFPILAFGCMSIPVSECASSVSILGIRGTPSNASSCATR